MAKKYKRSARGLLSGLFAKATPKRTRRKRTARRSEPFRGWK